MKLTKREAIRECKKLWEEIEESELSKIDFLNSPDGEKWADKNYGNDCPLCEYTGFLSCQKCPLKTQYEKDCCDLGFRDLDANLKGEISLPSFFEAVRGLKE